VKIDRQIVGYIRVSSEEQTKSGLSLENQGRKIGAFAESQDLKVDRILRDESKSAKNLNRTEVQEIIEGVKAKRIGRVIIYKLDRLTRSVRDLAYILELFEKYDATLSSVVETLDTASASGKMVVHIIGAIAEWERGVISERTKAALDVKRGRGERISGIIPYGFRLNGKKLTPDPVEHPVLERILKRRGEGAGYAQITRELNASGVKPRKARQWGVMSVRSVCLRAPKGP